ncbi:TetR/AcrR family transcriptional regulator [Glutamicibacter sp. JC586]|uniref:TetR/AcrR family transcriptional regulator n=1 Tax=Glutamicibacter sp. JC586 TaxID=2590552 RepID=UPI001356C7F2|nr:TetR/AcrR family transcriptional regulator [Glutamicibacter sp. JC586]
MGWDTEATRQKLLAAAIDEFAQRGFAGARIQDISKKSGCNRERIYFYFGNKEGLFEAALIQALSTTLDSTSVIGSGVQSVIDFAVTYFDFSQAHPNLARLTFWEGLERGVAVGPTERSLRAQAKVEEIRYALGLNDVAVAQNLLLTIVTLSNSLLVTENIAEVILGAEQKELRKATFIQAVRAIVLEASRA